MRVAIIGVVMSLALARDGAFTMPDDVVGAALASVGCPEWALRPRARIRVGEESHEALR